MPNIGIEFKGKAFLLDKTTLAETATFFQISDSLPTYFSSAEVFDADGNSLPCIESFQKRIDFKNLSFYFTGLAEDSLALSIIEVNLAGPLSVQLDNNKIDNSTLQIPQQYTDCIMFPVYGEDSHNALFSISGSKFGINFLVDSVSNKIELSKLFISKKID